MKILLSSLPVFMMSVYSIVKHLSLRINDRHFSNGVEYNKVYTGHQFYEKHACSLKLHLLNSYVQPKGKGLQIFL